MKTTQMIWSPNTKGVQSPQIIPEATDSPLVLLKPDQERDFQLLPDNKTSKLISIKLNNDT